MSALRLARALGGCVGAISLIWWAALFLQPSWRGPFFWDGLPEGVFLAFLPADLGVFIPSALWLAISGSRASWLIFCGASAYATLLTWGMSCLHGGGWLGAWLMAALMAGILGLEWRWRAESAPKAG